MQVVYTGFERGRNGLFAVCFDMLSAKGDYVMSHVTSAPVFRSMGAARKGGQRALAVVQRTGKFPNMCAYF